MQARKGFDKTNTYKCSLLLFGKTIATKLEYESFVDWKWKDCLSLFIYIFPVWFSSVMTWITCLNTVDLPLPPGPSNNSLNSFLAWFLRAAIAYYKHLRQRKENAVGNNPVLR
jgi:hypothetical protein